MGDNFDIDDDDFDDDVEEKPSLKKLWNENPVFKIVVVIVAVVVLYVGYSFAFGSSEEDENFSRVEGNATVTSVPGEEGLSPAQRRAREEKNEQELEAAMQSGNSFIPVPLGEGETSIELNSADNEDDLNKALSAFRTDNDVVRFNSDSGGPNSRVPQPGDPDFAPFEPAPFEPALTPAISQVQPQPPQMQGGDPELSARLAEQMRVIIATRQPKASTHITSMYPTPYSVMRNEQEARTLEGNSGQEVSFDPNDPIADDFSGDQSTQEPMGEILHSPGDIVYAQTLTAVNSDITAPVLVHILSGEFAGGRALGQFTRQETFLVLTFETIIKDGVTYEVEAIALDPDTTLAGVATDVDHHYLQRIIIPAAAEFVSGMAEGFAEQETTTTVVEGGTTVTDEEELDIEQEIALGIAEAGDRVSEILEENENREITVTLAKGTPVGMLFTTTVREQPGEQ